VALWRLALVLFCLALPAAAGEAGRLTVTCTTGAARVEVDGRPAGVTPLTVEVAPGLHRLRVARQGCPPFEQTLKVEARGSYTVEADLRPEGVGHLLYVDSADPEKVRRGWKTCVQRNPELAGGALVSPASRGWTALAARALEPLAPQAASRASQELSQILGTGVLHLVVSSDGRAWYFYFRQGQALDRYCSNPGRPGEVGQEVLRTWAGRPEVLLPVCRGRPLSARRSEVTLTDLNSVVYFYYPEMRQSRPAAYRTPAEIMRVLIQLVGVPQSPAPFASLVALPGWKKF
jgi:hypothetical protein